jgi:hypothetical protein
LSDDQRKEFLDYSMVFIFLNTYKKKYEKIFTNVINNEAENLLNSNEISEEQIFMEYVNYIKSNIKYLK